MPAMVNPGIAFGALVALVALVALCAATRTIGSASASDAATM